MCLPPSYWRISGIISCKFRNCFTASCNILQLNVSPALTMTTQVYSQPLYAEMEKWFANKFPSSRLVRSDTKQVHGLRLNPLRLCLRTAYVGFTTGFSIIFPYFNQVIGVAGALTFWPIIVYFPVEMYLVQKNIGPWTKKSIAFRIYSFITFLVILFAFVGSIKGLMDAKFS